MTETAKLLIAVETNGAQAATSHLSSLSRAAASTERSVAGLSSAVGGLVAPLLTLGTAFAAFGAITTTSRQFQVLEASLRTATGSAEKAEQAFGAIKQFAADTPYDLAQVTDSFLKLVNLGLDPSERALRSYGNTASALGKSLNQMIEAVADAATGEFERLKEFGIKASVQGDNVTLRFRGVATTVKNTSRDIERYLLSIGEASFSGTMQERMNTLDGALSNLGDAWSQLLATVGKEGGFGALVESQARLATAELQALTDYIASGQLQAHLEAVKAAFRGWGSDIAESVRLVTEFIRAATGQWQVDTTTAVGFLVDAFVHAPQNIRAAINIIGQALYSLAEEARIAATAVWDVLSSAFRRAAELARTVGKALWDGFSQKGRFDDLGFGATWQAFKDDVATAIAGAREAHDVLHTAAAERLEDIAAERDASIAASAAQVQAAERVRKAYDDATKARASATGDRLAEFRVGGGDASSGLGIREQQKLERQLDGLRKHLATEQEAVLMAYDERQRLLEVALDAQLVTREDYAALTVRNAVQTEEKLTDIAKDQADRRNRIQRQSVQLATGAILDFASETAKTFELIGERSGAAQMAAFAITKGVAVAQAIVNTELAATRALAEGGTFAGIPLASLIRATGYASVALIAAQTIAEVKRFEHGGFISANSAGIVGEAGPELVRGPAIVKSARSTADSAGAGQALEVSVVVNNMASDAVEVTAQPGADERTVQILVRRIKDSIAREVTTGGGAVARAMESAYGLNRGRA